MCCGKAYDLSTAHPLPCLVPAKDQAVHNKEIDTGRNQNTKRGSPERGHNSSGQHKDQLIEQGGD